MNNSSSNNLNAYIICRQSKATEDDNSLSRQFTMCKYFCNTQKFYILNTFNHIGSGWKGSYPNKLLKSFTDEMLPNSNLIIYSVDRFCRNVIIAKNILNELKIKNIRIFSLFNFGEIIQKNFLNSKNSKNLNPTSFNLSNPVDYDKFISLVNEGEQESLKLSKRQLAVQVYLKLMNNLNLPQNAKKFKNIKNIKNIKAKNTNNKLPKIGKFKFN
jgi:hypothetical protein